MALLPLAAQHVCNPFPITLPRCLFGKLNLVTCKHITSSLISGTCVAMIITRNGAIFLLILLFATKKGTIYSWRMFKIGHIFNSETYVCLSLVSLHLILARWTCENFPPCLYPRKTCGLDICMLLRRRLQTILVRGVALETFLLRLRWGCHNGVVSVLKRAWHFH